MNSEMWFPFRFDLFQRSMQLTDTGSFLELNPKIEGGAEVKGVFTLKKLGTIVEHGDVLQLVARIPDWQGTYWEASSTFSTAVLLKYLGDVTYEPSWPRYCDPDREEWRKENREQMLLQDLHYMNDGRYVRNFAVENTILGIYFEYTLISFNIAFQSKGVKALDICASSSGQGLVDDGGANRDIYYQIPVYYLLLHNTMSRYEEDPEKYMVDNGIPDPLIFKKTELKGDPQAIVQELT